MSAKLYKTKDLDTIARLFEQKSREYSVKADNATGSTKKELIARSNTWYAAAEILRLTELEK